MTTNSSVTASQQSALAAGVARKILVVEDNREVAEVIEVNLRDLFCEVDLAFNGPAALANIQAQHYDLIILDLMLPGIDGLEICRRVRARTPYTPIIMVTARASEMDRVLGLELGADDYLAKPFSMMELLARVKAVFRRADATREHGMSNEAEIIRAGDLLIDLSRHEVSIGGRLVALTVKEFELLLHFARNPGRVYTRVQLLDIVWGTGFAGYEHNVNCHINRLRAKIERDQSRPEYVLTVRGVGYKFAESPPRGTA